MRKFLMLCVLVAVGSATAQEVLVTPGYAVTVIGCKEGVVSCDDARYIGVSRKSGKVVTLKGRTLHTTAADGVTPSRFLGYEFRSGSTVYRVSEEGVLDVRRGEKLVLNERGQWAQ